MLIELAVGAGLVVLGALAIQRTRRIRRAEAARAADGRTENGRRATSDDPAARGPRAAKPRGLRIGDVILHADTELWLAGEIYLDEEGFALALFATPGAKGGSFVAQLDPEAREIALLDRSTDVPDGLVPAELPVDGIRLKLRRKGCAKIDFAGEHLPNTTERARYAVLGGPGGRLLVVVDFDGGDRLALSGERLSDALYDLLPGGDAKEP